MCKQKLGYPIKLNLNLIDWTPTEGKNYKFCRFVANTFKCDFDIS